MDLLQFLDVFVVFLEVLHLNLIRRPLIFDRGKPCLTSSSHDSIELPCEWSQLSAVPFKKVDDIIVHGLGPQSCENELLFEVLAEVVDELGHVG